MHNSAPCWILALAVAVTANSLVSAQAPGTRNTTSGVSELRQRLRSGENPGSIADDVGEISGDERFVREARDATDFVGADSREEGSFVGSQAGSTSGEIRSAIEGDLVREAIAPALNRLQNLPQLRSGMYAPRLRLGFEPTTLPPPMIEAEVSYRVSTAAAIRPTRPIEVSMAGRTATLRGAVGSEHEKRLAGLMLLLEPGISKVENDLAVVPAAPTPPALQVPQ